MWLRLFNSLSSVIQISKSVICYHMNIYEKKSLTNYAQCETVTVYEFVCKMWIQKNRTQDYEYDCCLSTVEHHLTSCATMKRPPHWCAITAQVS